MAREKRELMGVMFNDTLKPITDYQHEYHRKNSAEYIFVWDKEKHDAFCTKCETNFIIDHKTTHKNIEKCPCCKKKMKIYHTWRTENFPPILKYMVIPKTINNHTLVLRYIEAYSGYDMPLVKTKEVARMYIDEYRTEPEYWSYKHIEKEDKMAWVKHKCPYFNPSAAFYIPNKHFVGDAYEYPRNFFKEINKLDCFKYYPVDELYYFGSYSMQLHYLIRSAKVNEKLSKLNLGIRSINDYHRSYYINNNDRCFPHDNTKNDLASILKLDKRRFKILMKCTFDIDFLKYLQKNKDVNETELIQANYQWRKIPEYKEWAEKLGISFGKFTSYINNFTGMDGRASYGEYIHYLHVLEELHYDLKNTYYSMPKDFRKADKRITEEYSRLKYADKDVMIAKISKGLRELPEIKELCGNSKGLLIYVPENANDLIMEGRNQSNCVGTYVGRIAEKKTLVFFIRRLEDPTASFVTMEITYDGVVRQVMYKRNEPVKDENIIDFASKVADIVKKHSKELLKVA